MSRGSTFVILKKTDQTVSKDEILNNQLRECLTGNPITLDDLPEYIYHSEDCYVNKFNTHIYTPVVSASFISTFTCLSEEFYLNPYDLKHDRVVFTMSTVEDMAQAIRYLYNSDYSSKLEEVLSNPFIEIFGDLHDDYV